MASSFISLLPRPQEPVALYGPQQLQSLANMRTQNAAQQQQMDQSAAIAPLQQQQAQLQVQNLQNEQRMNQIFQETQEAQNVAASTPQTGTPPSGPAQPATPAQPPSAIQPGSSMGTAPAVAPDSLLPAMGTGPSAIQPASTMGNTAAPGYTAPPAATAAPTATPAGPSSFATEFQKRANAAGLGALAPGFMQKMAVAQQEQIKAQEAQQDQTDQQITKDAYAQSGGDLGRAADLAQQAGISFKGLTAIKGYQATLAANILKQKEAQDDLGAKDFAQEQRNQETLRDHLDAFAKRPTDDSEDGQNANWQNFLSSNSGLMTAEHMTATLQKHPGPPTPAELTSYHNALTTSAMATADAQRQALTQNAARSQRDDLLTSLAGQQNAADYNKVLDASNAPHDDIPRGETMFDANGPIKGRFDMLDSMGLTPSQKSAAKIAANNLQATTNYRNAQINLGQQRVNEGQERIDQGQQRINQTPAQHKQYISALADQAVSLTNAARGKTLPEALANVNNQDLFNDGEGAPIGQYRGEVAKELQSRISGPAKDAAALAHTQASTTALQNKGAAPANPIQPLIDRTAWSKDPANAGKPAPDDATIAAWKKTRTAATPTPPVKTTTTNTPQTWNVGGKQRAAGSPIWVGGKQVTFDGLDPKTGNVLYH